MTIFRSTLLLSIYMRNTEKKETDVKNPRENKATVNMTEDM